MIMLIQGIGHSIYPPPEDISSGDTQAILKYIETAPTMALAIIPLGYLIGIFAAELIACRWTYGNNLSIIIVGVLLLAAIVLTLVEVPHPTWMAVSNVLGGVIPLGVSLYLAPRCRKTANGEPDNPTA